MSEGLAAYRRAKRRADLFLFAALGVAAIGIAFREHAVGRFLAVVGEAAFVAATADWFAITALFSHPLGPWIPLISRHTAIIPRQRRQIGLGLRDLVEKELLPAKEIRRWIASIDLTEEALRASDADGGRFAERAYEWVRARAIAVPLDRAAAVVHGALIAWLRTQPLAPLFSRGLKKVLAIPGAEAWIERMLERARTSVDSEAFRRTIEELLKKEIRGEEKEPTGLVGRFTSFVRRAAVDFGERRGAIDYAELAARFQEELSGELERMRDREHPVRTEFRTRLFGLADSLTEDRELAEDVERWKNGLLDRTDLIAETRAVLAWIKKKIADEPAGGGAAFGAFARDIFAKEIDRLRADPAERSDLNARFVAAADPHIDRLYAALLDLVITGFESRLPGDRLTAFVQEHVGDTLQNLRITSTIVGAVVGTIIHLLGRVLA